MKSVCELCEAGEPSILGATSGQIAVGEKCYSKLLEAGAVWGPETSLDELRATFRKEYSQQ
jgi:hypothetical protein